MSSGASPHETIAANLRDAIRVKEMLLGDRSLLGEVARAAELLAAAVRGGHTAIFVGNGGSAADATHLAAELVVRFKLDRPPLPALSLTDNMSSISAIANDFSYDEVFARQVQAFGRPGDVVVALSTSGTSPNVVRALETAARMGLTSIAFTGASGGRCLALATICVRIPSSDTARIQECTMTLCHSICELVELSAFGPAQGAKNGVDT
jgi:D-sedoheptulose 7-phosphate isomerase